MQVCLKCEKGGTGPHPPHCTPEMRFWNKVRSSDTCWEWQGSQNGLGYGEIRLDVGVKVYAHRYSWELANGHLSASSVVRHHCDNPCCVRPEHLGVGTQRDNWQDAFDRGRWHPPTPPPPKTHCVNGHEYTEANTYLTTDGWRNCRACHRTKERERQRRLRENAINA